MINKEIKRFYDVNYFLRIASEAINADALLLELSPPKHFDGSGFDNYIPESNHLSQSAALDQVKKFIDELQESSSASLTFFRRLLRTSKTVGKAIYLDGGFGVGKTHLLASAFHKFEGAKAYMSFQELMFLVGLQSLAGVVRSFRNIQLLVIDEFELDDPANTRISTNLLGQLFDAGVSILTSSNTPPGALGEGKFSGEDFQRELGILMYRFETIRIDGEDYRSLHHLDEGEGSTWVAGDQSLKELLSGAVIDEQDILDVSFQEFLYALSKVHPMRVRKAVGKLDAVILRDVVEITHPHEALRFVYFVDKAYDDNLILIASSGVETEKIFNRSYFVGGDTKKYLRTISRLREMCRTGYSRLNP